MKNLNMLKFLLLLVSVVFLALSLSTVKAEPPVTPDQQAKIDELKPTYPLTTCPVSGDKLDNNAMGTKPIDYLYTQKNADGTETTRLVRFCCKDCVAKFKKNPEKFLKIIDEAKTKKATSSDSSMPNMKGMPSADCSGCMK